MDHKTYATVFYFLDYIIMMATVMALGQAMVYAGVPLMYPVIIVRAEVIVMTAIPILVPRECGIKIVMEMVLEQLPA